MSAPVTVAVADQIAVITIDNPPVNAAGHAVRAGLVAAAAQIAADPRVRGAILRCAGRTFVAGADITEFGRPPQSPTLAEVVSALESLDKPVCALLHGTALGGGFELALGCHLRLIDPAGLLGLPEVTLGLIPGAGGTQRLPRLVGVAAALDMITTGRRIGAAEALALGLVDGVVAGDPLAFAQAYLRERLGTPPHRLSARPAPVPTAAALAAARSAVAKRLPGQIAPLRAIEVVEQSAGLPFQQGMAREAAAFAALRGSAQSAALRHIFFAERAAAKVPELEDARPRPLERMGVIGGGTMGAGIAAALLLAGWPVALVERDRGAAAAGRDRVAAILAESVARGKLDAPGRTAMLDDRLVTTADWAVLADADGVIEAVFEDRAAKEAVLSAASAVIAPNALLATNTSYLDVAALAASVPHPGRVIGLHFFAPAHVMKLLEIVVPAGADPSAVATGFALARRLGKLGVRSGNAEGFIGNRILSAYRKAADYVVLDGASPYAVDEALRAFGFPMGLYAMQDLAGLDIGWATRKRLAPTRDPKERVSRVADRLCEAGRFGRKTGAGFFRYPDGHPVPDPAVEAIVAEERQAAGLLGRPFTATEIQRRIVLAAINEGARVLAEGIALRAGDIDVVMVNGYSFPRWRGGPMHMADADGLPAILDEIRALATEDAWFWRPAPLLVRLAADAGRFAGAGV